jgi:tRNA dimethylallyltransferase
LAKVDPESAARLHPHDRVKIVRALEVYHLTKQPLSEVHRRHAFADRPFAPLLLGLNRERAALYGRIDARVEEQLAKGLIEETRRLLDEGFSRTLGSMKGLGYRQIAGFLEGEYDYAEAVRRLKRDTRHFAKRQMTWFRKEAGLRWLMVPEGEPADQTASRIVREACRFLDSLLDDREQRPVHAQPSSTASAATPSAGLSGSASL